MVSVTTLKLVIDTLLALAVLYLAYRTQRTGGRSVQPEALRDIERTLTALLREAKQSSEELEASLVVKQRNLEELLADIQAVEHRINKGIDASAEERRKLQAVVRNAEDAARDFGRRVDAGQTHSIHDLPETSHQAPTEIPLIARPAPIPVQETEIRHVETFPQFAPRPIDREIASPKEKTIETQQAQSVIRPQNSPAKLNIFGEPIQEPPPRVDSAPERPARSLRTSITKEVVTQKRSPVVEEKIQRAIEDVYAECEELLRAGHSISEVANTMRLPAYEVEALKGILESEEESQHVLDDDVRLGVLAPRARRSSRDKNQGVF